MIVVKWSPPIQACDECKAVVVETVAFGVSDVCLSCLREAVALLVPEQPEPRRLDS